MDVSKWVTRQAPRFLTRLLLRGGCLTCGRPARLVLCDSCAQSPTPPHEVLDQGIPVLSGGLYEGRLGELVRRFKYDGETCLANPLARFLAERQPWILEGNFTLVPVPLHPRRLAERGFNQSALLARAIARLGNSRVAHDLLFRTRHTSTQATLNGRSRSANVSRAFAFRGHVPRSPVVLIDDVFTTGSTVRECVLCLSGAGAIVRGVMTVARALQVKQSTTNSIIIT